MNIYYFPIIGYVFVRGEGEGTEREREKDRCLRIFFFGEHWNIGIFLFSRILFIM